MYDLVVAVLPELSPEAIRRADLRLGTRVLGAIDWTAFAEAERARLTELVRRVEADPSIAQRRELDADGIPAALGRIAAERDEHTRFMSECRHPRVAQLIEKQYGTERYAVGFWRMSYYEDWKAGDEVLEFFTEFERFGQLRERYLKAEDFLSRCDPWRARLEAERDKIRAAVKALDDATLCLVNVSKTMLDQAREMVRERIAKSGLVALGAFLATDPELTKLALVCEGRRAQRAYLDAIIKHAVQPLLRDLRAFGAALGKDIKKFRSPKRAGAWLPQAKVTKRMEAPGKLFKKLFERYEPAYNTINRFERFERGRLDEDFLWWELMVGAVTATCVVPEVEAFIAAHPDRVPMESDIGDEMAEAVAELAEAALDSDLGDVS